MAEFEITIVSSVAGYHYENKYTFNEYGLLASYSEEETDKATVFLTIAYSEELVA